MWYRLANPNFKKTVQQFIKPKVNNTWMNSAPVQPAQPPVQPPVQPLVQTPEQTPVQTPVPVNKNSQLYDSVMNPPAANSVATPSRTPISDKLQLLKSDGYKLQHDDYKVINDSDGGNNYSDGDSYSNADSDGQPSKYLTNKMYEQDPLDPELLELFKAFGAYDQEYEDKTKYDVNYSNFSKKIEDYKTSQDPKLLESLMQYDKDTTLHKLTNTVELCYEFPDLVKQRIISSSLSGLDTLPKGILTPEFMINFIQEGNPIITKDGLSLVGKTMSMIYHHKVESTPELLNTCLQNDFNKTLGWMTSDQKEQVNLMQYVDGMDLSSMQYLQPEQIDQISPDQWEKMISKNPSDLQYVGSQIKDKIPKEIINKYLTPDIIRNLSYNIYPYLNLESLDKLRDTYPSFYTDLMRYYYDYLDDSILKVAISQFKKWLYSPAGLKYAPIDSMNSYMFNKLSKKQQKMILEHAPYQNMSHYIKTLLTPEQIFAKEKESGFKDVLHEDLYPKFSPEQLKELILASPIYLAQLPWAQAQSLGMGFYKQLLAKDIKNYSRIPLSIKIKMGKSVFKNIKVAQIPYIASQLPAEVIEKLSDKERDYILDRAVKYGTDLPAQLWEYAKTPAQEAKLFASEPSVQSVPHDKQESYSEHLEQKYGANLPEFFKKLDIEANFSSFYRANPETKSNFNAAFRQEFGHGPYIDIHSVLDSWDSGYKRTSSTKQLLYAANKIVGKTSAVDQENFDNTDGYDGYDVVNDLEGTETLKELEWGLKKVYQNTQDMFRQMGITHIPIARFKGVSIENLDKRFPPEIANQIRAKLQLKKPFMLTFQNAPMNERVMASATYNPNAIWSSFGGSKGSKSLSVKVFANVPVENIMAAKNSCMLDDHSSEDEVIIFNTYDLPCTLVITYGYIDVNSSSYSEVHSNILKSIGDKKFFNKAEVPYTEFTKNNIFDTQPKPEHKPKPTETPRAKADNELPDLSGVEGGIELPDLSELSNFDDDSEDSDSENELPDLSDEELLKEFGGDE